MSRVSEALDRLKAYLFLMDGWPNGVDTKRAMLDANPISVSNYFL